MRIGIWIPIVLLAAVVAFAPVVLWLDTNRKRLEQRVSIVTGAGGGPDWETQVQRSIRLSRPREGRGRDLVYALLRIPVDLPLAHVMPAWTVFVAAVIAAVATICVVRVFLPLPAAVVIGAGAGLLLPRGFFGWEQKRYREKLFGQLPDTIELVVSATRAGLPVAEAFRGVVREMPRPISHEFGRVVNEIALGVPPDEALMTVHRRTRLSEFAIFAVTIGIQTKSGGRLTESIQNLAEMVRQRIAVAARADALAAEVKLSARVISAMPFIAGAMMEFLHPGYLDPLFHDPRGKRMFVVGVTTLLLGIVTIRKLISGVTRE